MTASSTRRSFFSTSIRPSGFVDIALLLALCGTWLGLFGRWHWSLDLFSHFRWQYLVICPVAVVLPWCLAARDLTGARLNPRRQVNRSARSQAAAEAPLAAGVAGTAFVATVCILLAAPDA